MWLCLIFCVNWKKLVKYIIVIMVDTHAEEDLIFIEDEIRWNGKKPLQMKFRVGFECEGRNALSSIFSHHIHWKFFFYWWKTLDLCHRDYWKCMASLQGYWMCQSYSSLVGSLGFPGPTPSSAGVLPRKIFLPGFFYLDGAGRSTAPRTGWQASPWFITFPVPLHSFSRFSPSATRFLFSRL